MSKTITEDSSIISTFIEKTKNLDWTDTPNTLNTLKNEAFDLLQAEIDYYNKSRIPKKKLFEVSRLFMFIFAMLGLVTPLVLSLFVALEIEPFKLVAQNLILGNLGYLFLVMSGVCYTANNLFGGSRAHARYYKTQFKLEKLYVLKTVEWGQLELQHYQDSRNSENIEKEMFKFIIATLIEGFELIANETQEWDAALKDSMSSFEKNQTAKQK